MCDPFPAPAPPASSFSGPQHLCLVMNLTRESGETASSAPTKIKKGLKEDQELQKSKNLVAGWRGPGWAPAGGRDGGRCPGAKNPKLGKARAVIPPDGPHFRGPPVCLGFLPPGDHKASPQMTRSPGVFLSVYENEKNPQGDLCINTHPR